MPKQSKISSVKTKAKSNPKKIIFWGFNIKEEKDLTILITTLVLSVIYCVDVFQKMWNASINGWFVKIGIYIMFLFVLFLQYKIRKPRMITMLKMPIMGLCLIIAFTVIALIVKVVAGV